MRLRLVALPAITVLASAVMTVVPSVARTASADCTFTPVLPKRVVVNRAPTTFRTPVKIGGTGCAKNFSASIDLRHKGDTYELAWQYNARTSINNVYPVTVKPGTYTTTPSTHTCSVTGTNGSLSCAVGNGSTVIKFGGKAHLSANRLSGKNNDKVEFTVRATHYAQYKTAYLSTRVHLQREDSGTWQTIHTATTNGKQGYTFTYSHSQSAKYRAVFADTNNTFGATSGTVNQ